MNSNTKSAACSVFHIKIALLMYVTVLIGITFFFFVNITRAAQSAQEEYRPQETGTSAIDETVNVKRNNDDIVKTSPFIPGFQLTLTKSGTGSGNVAGSEISCGTSCIGLFPRGTVLELTAAPDTGSVFAGWSGGGCTGTTTCTFIMNDNTDVIASFTKVFIITTVAGKHGTITAADPTPKAMAAGETATICQHSVEPGSSLTFGITPRPGFHVEDVKVDGVSTGLDSTYTFADVTSDHTLTAAFASDAGSMSPSKDENGDNLQQKEMTAAYRSN